MALVNVMEKIVDNKLEHFLEGVDCCKCSVCLADMKAHALNKLPPKYVNTSTGELFTRVDVLLQQNNVDVDIAINHAINAVAARPRHEVK